MSYPSLLGAIGNTPLVTVPLQSEGTILAKLEYLNPGGSVKDRSAFYMVEHAEKAGILKPGGTLIDASSGNHGIALAMIGAIKGYRVIIVVSEKISKEKLQTIKAYGAEVIVCKPTEFIDDPQSYHFVAQRLAQEIPNSFMPNQYYNVVNREAHQSLLGPELWNQTNGTITHFFAGAGTGGTVSGVGRYLKSKNPNIKVYGIDSVNSFRSTNGHPKPYSLEGIGIDFTSEVLDYNVIDKIVTVSDSESIDALKLLAKEFGMLTGPSSGAVFAGLLKEKDTFTKDSVAVIMFSDSGRAYLSKGFYDEQGETVAPTYSNTATPEAIQFDAAATTK